MRNLLRPELYDAYPRLYERAADQWRYFVGTWVLDISGAVGIWAGIEAHDSRATAIGGVVAGLGLLASGFTLGQLHETSKAFDEALNKNN